MRTIGLAVMALVGAAWTGAAAAAAPPLDVLRAPSAGVQFDQVAVLQSEVKKLQSEVAALKASMRNHTHTYRTMGFGIYAVSCGNLQPGARGKCYVMLDPDSREMTTSAPNP